MIRVVALGPILSLAIVVGSATAQVQSPTVNAPTSATTKQVVSKACSDQANAKGLHGKERKKFRSECKKRGGK